MRLCVCVDIHGGIPWSAVEEDGQEGGVKCEVRGTRFLLSIRWEGEGVFGASCVPASSSSHQHSQLGGSSQKDGDGLVDDVGRRSGWRIGRREIL